MTKKHLILLALLLVQVGLAALTWQRSDTPTRPDATTLLDLSAEDIATLTLTTRPQGETPGRVMTFQRDGDAWRLASADDYPAKVEKLKDLTDKLTELTVREPIATQASSHHALRVAERNFDRRLTLTTSDGETQTWLLGRGSGSTVNVRRVGEDVVYQGRGLTLGDLSTVVSSYVDTKYVDVKRDALRSVTIANAHGTLELTKVDDDWTLASGTTSEALDKTKTSTLINDVSQVFFNNVLGTTVKPDYGLDQGTRVTLEYMGDDDVLMVLAYTLGAATRGGDGYHLKADTHDHVVTIANARAEKILNAKADDLLAADAAQDDPRVGNSDSTPPMLPAGMTGEPAPSIDDNGGQ